MKKYLFLICMFLSLSAHAASDNVKGHDSSKPVEITADSLEVIQEQNKAIFSGSVQAKQDDLDIRSGRMTVYYKKSGDNAAKSKNGDASSKIVKIEIEDNVFISTPKETAKGNKGIYDVDAGVITLEGGITLTSGKNIVKGSKLVYNLKTGQSKIVSGGEAGNGKKERVRGVFVPNGK